MASVELPAPIGARSPVRPLLVTTGTLWCIAGAALVALMCLAGGANLLNDPDTQWHIAAGRWMIENGTLPRVDTMSHTFGGQPWIAKEWLSQLLLAVAYQTGGWPMVVALTALAMALLTAIVMHHIAARAGLVAGFSLAVVVFGTVAATVVARPHVLVFPVIAAWTICLLRSAETSRRPPWHALPLLALWANMHAGFTIGFVIAAAFGLEALLRAEAGARIATALRWLGFGLACLAMGIATPYGAEPLLLNVLMASGNEAIPYIGEWRSMGATPRTGALLALSGLSIFVLARMPRQNAARMLLLVLLTWMMVRHERFAMFFGLVAPILAGPLLWQFAQDICRRLEIFQTGFEMPAGVTAHRAAAGLGAIAVAVLALNPITLPAKVAPAAALAAVPVEFRDRPVFNSYNLGGFLAQNGVKTFIDGRTDQLFLGGFITRVEEAKAASQPGLLAKLLDQYGVEWAIVSADMPEVALFPRLDGWRRIHRDQVTHVFVRERR